MTGRHTSAPPDLAPGALVRVQFTKWGGHEHWGAESVWLGEDEHGWWLGDRRGTQWNRPAMSFVSHTNNVMLLPRDRGFAAMFYERHRKQKFRLYVDVTTVPRWEGATVTCVDLDLDVIQRFNGSVMVDDEDEFAEHQVRYGYPAEVIAAAEAECRRLVDEIRSGATRFSEGLAVRWRSVLTSL